MTEPTMHDLVNAIPKDGEWHYDLIPGTAVKYCGTFPYAKENKR